MDDLIEALRAFDAQIQQVECPACGQQAGWDWQAREAETSMTCRNCGVKQLPNRATV
jgi:predicted RNA-binding Zn-ribbon protein involved in translation (DUF1610 family)